MIPLVYKGSEKRNELELCVSQCYELHFQQIAQNNMQAQDYLLQSEPELALVADNTTVRQSY